MYVADAIALDPEKRAKLIIKDPNDPCGWGTVTEDGFGTLYIAVMGHSAPIMICQYEHEKPTKKEQMVCSCGGKHGFPNDRELLFRLHRHTGWTIMDGDEHPLITLARTAKSKDEDEGEGIHSA